MSGWPGGAFEEEMLPEKYTKGSVSHSGSDYFAVTSQEVQARWLEVQASGLKVIQKEKKKKRNPMELKCNCLFCSEACAEHNPACRHHRGAQSKEADN